MYACERDRTNLAVDDASSTFDLIHVVLSQPKEGGFSFDDIAKRLAIRSAADKVRQGGDLLLEGPDAVLLQELAAACRWSGIFDIVPPFVLAVLEMKDVEVRLDN